MPAQPPVPLRCGRRLDLRMHFKGSGGMVVLRMHASMS